MLRRSVPFLLSSLLAIAIVLTGCNPFIPSGSSGTGKRTDVEIVDPYGNKLFVKGTINGFEIKADAKGVYVPAEIEVVTDYKFTEDLGVLKVKEFSVVPKKSVTFVLEKAKDKGIGLLRSTDGKLVFYAFGYGDEKYFQVWLKDRLSTTQMRTLNSEQVFLAGGWLVGVGKPLKGAGNGLGLSKDEIVFKTDIPISKIPEIAKIEVIRAN